MEEQIVSSMPQGPMIKMSTQSTLLLFEWEIGQNSGKCSKQSSMKCSNRINPNN